MLRSMDGGSISHMPVDPSTTYEGMHKILDECYAKANPDGDPDPWLDLQDRDEPQWGGGSSADGDRIMFQPPNFLSPFAGAAEGSAPSAAASATRAPAPCASGSGPRRSASSART